MKKIVMVLLVSLLMLTTYSVHAEEQVDENKIVLISVVSPSLEEMAEASNNGKLLEILFPIKDWYILDAQYLSPVIGDAQMTYGAFLEMHRMFGVHTSYTYAEVLAAKLSWVCSKENLDVIRGFTINSNTEVSELFDKHIKILTLLKDSPEGAIHTEEYNLMTQSFVCNDLQSLDIEWLYNRDKVRDSLKSFCIDSIGKTATDIKEIPEFEVGAFEAGDSYNPEHKDGYILGEDSVSQFYITTPEVSQSDKYSYREVLLGVSLVVIAAVALYSTIHSFLVKEQDITQTYKRRD